MSDPASPPLRFSAIHIPCPQGQSSSEVNAVQIPEEFLQPLFGSPPAGVKDPEELTPNQPTDSVFAPFFTLIEDVRRKTAHHPTVHYIFSDDPPDPIIEAALRIHDTPLPLPSSSGYIAHSTQFQPHERRMILKLEPCGLSVESAHSMDSDWQVLDADISAAPTLEGENVGKRGLMLRIQGTEGVSDEVGEEVGMEGLVEIFEKRMAELRRIVEKGDQNLGLGVEAVEVGDSGPEFVPD